MHFALDIREACRSQRTGKGQWTKGFVTELARRDHPLTLLTNAALPMDWDQGADVNVLRFRPGWVWHCKAAKFLRSQNDIDCYISPTSYIVPYLLGSSFSCTPVIHDLIAFRGEPHDRKAQLIERCTLHRIVRTAAHLFTVSETTKRDLLARYPSLEPESVTGIFAGPLREKPKRSEPDGKTILCPGTLSPRKNQLRLIRAYASLPSSLRDQYQLILVGGRGWHDAEIVRLAEETEGVVWRGYIPEQEYDSLLTTCTVLAFPSLYEGFGMPILDALQRGVPAITSDRGSLSEVGGDAALVVDPEDEGSIANGLERILSDSSLRDSLGTKGPSQAAKFTWKRTVDLFLDATMCSCSSTNA